MSAGALIVDLADPLSLVVMLRRGEPDIAAGIVGGRQLPGDVHRRRAEEARIDPVVYKGAAQRDLLTPVAGGRGEPRKVAEHHPGARDARNCVRGRYPEKRPLIGGEEEQTGGPDRPAEHASWLIPFEAV